MDAALGQRDMLGPWSYVLCLLVLFVYQDGHDDLEAGMMLHQVQAVDDAGHAAAGAAAPDHDDGGGSDPPQSDVESGPAEEPAVVANDADHAAPGTGAAAPDHDDGGGSDSDPPQCDVDPGGPVEEPAVVAIPKVREGLRRVAGDLFTPQTVAIGPYHQSDGGGTCPFPWTEAEKTKVVRHVATLTGDADLTSLKLLVAQMAPRVRDCYTHPLDPTMDSSEPFCRMLLHDGCYVLSFFVDFAPPQSNGTTTDDSTDVRAAIAAAAAAGEHIAARDNTLVRDIVYLLENQIPLPFLTRMLDHIRVVVPGQKSAVNCIADPIGELLHKQLYISHHSSTTTQTVPSSSTPSDLLHLAHFYFRRGLPQPQQDPQRLGQGARRRSLTGRWRRATDYSRHADVRFRRRAFSSDEQWTVLDVRHDGGTLHVPLLRVGASTLTMLRNLMALEERLEERPVTAYCVFVSQLACTAEDVDLLQRAKVLEHFLGSDDEAARALADLCNGVALDIDNVRRNYLKPIWHHLDRRCRMPLHNFKGLFRDKYCRNVFYRMVFCVALALFLCQVIQVTYAVLAYHRPPK